jgi:hypothetical protein
VPFIARSQGNSGFSLEIRTGYSFLVEIQTMYPHHLETKMSDDAHPAARKPKSPGPLFQDHLLEEKGVYLTCFMGLAPCIFKRFI